MIKHIVCFKLKNDSIELRNKTKEILLSMRGKVPMLVDMNVGIDFLGSPRSYDIILETYFNSKEDLDKYQNNPYHCEIVKTNLMSLNMKLLITKLALIFGIANKNFLKNFMENFMISFFIMVGNKI